jgi:hypothetical protein
LIVTVAEPSLSGATRPEASTLSTPAGDVAYAALPETSTSLPAASLSVTTSCSRASGPSSLVACPACESSVPAACTISVAAVSGVSPAATRRAAAIINRIVSPPLGT